MEEETVLIKAVVKRVQDGVLTVKLCDGFANAEVLIHEKADVSPSNDDLTRLPLLLAAEMTKKLESKRLAKGGREGWLRAAPKELLRLLRQEVDELEDAIRREPDNVLSEAVDVANFALFVADKADKLEPVPALVDPDAVEA